MTGAIDERNLAHGANPRSDHERWIIVPLVVIGLLWSLVVSRPLAGDHLYRGGRTILSLDWSDVALRARAAQSPTISSSPAR